MIVGYRDKRTADFAAGKRVKAFSGIDRPAQLKLDRLEAAHVLHDLAALPGNRFEALKGDRKGQYSIRLNGQRAISGDTALRLAHFFGMSPQFWLNLQSLYEIRLAEEKSGKAIRKLPSLKRVEEGHA